MPIATPEQYAEMLDKAKAGGFAYPAFNVSSSQTINAVLQGLTEAGSDGIIQVTTGGADYFAGQTVKNRASGALAFAAFAHEVAKNYPITVALHTDHCPKDALPGFVFPLIEASEAEVRAGRNPIFQSHMWDGSSVPLSENLEIAREILPRMKAINAILEVEIGVVGGEEDGVSHDINEHLYTTLDDAIATVEALGLGEQGRYMAEEYPTDIAIVDLGLPKASGIEVIKGARKAGRKFPVLILTARDGWQSKVEGLEAGADDYLVKPFHREELMARVRALLRRSGGWAHAKLESGPISLDTAAKTVTVGDKPVELTSYEYRVLEYLLTHAGKVISKSELTEHLYTEDEERDSNVIEVFIRRLRSKLEDDPSSPELILTARGTGYMFQNYSPSSAPQSSESTVSK